MNIPAAGQAYYQQAELHRLREISPRPRRRIALRTGTAASRSLASRCCVSLEEMSTRPSRRSAALGETSGPLKRAALLPAYVEIMLAAGDVERARDAARELEEPQPDTSAACSARSPPTRAQQSSSRRTSRSGAGIAPQAQSVWQELDAPYEAARVRVLVGSRLPRAGDEDSAVLELDAARAAFEQLGAAPDVERVDSLAVRDVGGETHGLSGRELEFRLVAQERRIVRSPARSSSASTPWRGTCRTSSASSASRRAPLRPRSPSSTSWSGRNLVRGQIDHSPRE